MEKRRGIGAEGVAVNQFFARRRWQVVVFIERVQRRQVRGAIEYRQYQPGTGLGETKIAIPALAPSSPPQLPPLVPRNETEMACIRCRLRRGERGEAGGRGVPRG